MRGASLKVIWNELKYKCEVYKDLGKLPLIQCYPTQTIEIESEVGVGTTFIITLPLEPAEET